MAPEGLPADYWDQAAGQVRLPELIKSFGEATAFKTEHEQRVATLPKRADEYKLEIKLPDGVEAPKDLELKIDEKDQRVGPLREFALKHQLPQDALNELVALDAQYRIAQYNQAAAELQAEMQKLGENGPQRTTAMETFLKANVDASEYEAMRPFVSDAAAFAGLEKLIAKITTQRIPPNPSPTPPPAAPKSHAEQIWPQGFQQRKAS